MAFGSLGYVGEVMIAYMNVLQNSQQGMQYLNVSCACRKVREYGVCVLITHLDRRKEQEHPKTSFVEVIVIIKNDESKS